MLKQPRAQEGPGPAVFVLWREMTSAFKGQAGSGREIAQSFPLLPAPASSRGAESTQGWRDDGQGSDPEAEPSPERSRQICLKRLFGLHQEKGWLHATNREASTAAPKHTDTLPALFRCLPACSPGEQRRHGG